MCGVCMFSRIFTIYEHDFALLSFM
eukprot:SAG11_NODE_41240_length_196_cov_53.979381_1_plen_24_part_10